ncbi:MAG: ATP-binding protein [Allosphingosinicella sp.]
MDPSFYPGLAAQSAIYHPQTVRAYRNNPFIEALPPTLSREQAQELMAFYPEYEEEDRQACAIDAEHMASALSAIRHPVGIHGELYSRVSRLIRNGYMSRNPALRTFQAEINAREALLTGSDGPADALLPPQVRRIGGYILPGSSAATANGLTFLGTSGIGKTIAIDMVLGLFPPLILHHEYRGSPLSRVQIPWIKLDAPSDGSVLTLADGFFHQLDLVHHMAGLHAEFHDTYLRSRATEKRVPTRIARVAAQIGLGLFVLDEIQDLSPDRSARLLSFLVQFANTVGVPVVLIGGLDAFPLLSKQFRQARRGATEGDLIVSNAEPGTRWRGFCEILWKYQYTRERADLTDAHVEALYEVSQGITEFLVIAFKLAQIRAISTNRPKITPGIIRSIKDSLAQAGPALTAVKRGSSFVLDRLSDLTVPRGVETIPFMRGDGPVPPAPAPAEPPVKKAASKAPDQDAARSKAPAARRSPSVPIVPVAPTQETGDQEPTLLQIVKAGEEEGLSPHDSLARAGLAGGEVWDRILDAGAADSPQASS